MVIKRRETVTPAEKINEFKEYKYSVKDIPEFTAVSN